MPSVTSFRVLSAVAAPYPGGCLHGSLLVLSHRSSWKFALFLGKWGKAASFYAAATLMLDGGIRITVCGIAIEEYYWCFWSYDVNLDDPKLKCECTHTHRCPHTYTWHLSLSLSSLSLSPTHPRRHTHTHTLSNTHNYACICLHDAVRDAHM